MRRVKPTSRISPASVDRRYSARGLADPSLGQAVDLLRMVQGAPASPEAVLALESLRARHPDRPLETNLEFYTALASEALGITRDLFTPTFAVG